jgi:LAO/AO transport system kinase
MKTFLHATRHDRGERGPDPGAEFVHRLLDRDRATVARAISIVESRSDQAVTLLHRIHGHTGRAFRIGITGPPGAGKSTMTSALAGQARRAGLGVAVIAVDPSSPFTQGAVLGDRVRMSGLDNDDGVFIRSMATRGTAGGLSATTCDAADIMDAAGFDLIFIESVGIGQAELKIEQVVDTTIVVLVPESGDQVQAIKAGLMEIADIYVLNKQDRPGSQSALNALQSALAFTTVRTRERPPAVLATIASQATGVPELFDELLRHRDYLASSGALQQRRDRALQSRIRDNVNERLNQSFWSSQRELQLQQALAGIRQGLASPQQAVHDLLAGMMPCDDQDEDQRP